MEEWYTGFRTPSGMMVWLASEQSAMELMEMPLERASSYQKEVIKILKERFPSRGLGDSIAKVTSAVGIRPCGGCGKRRELFNTMFPYKNRMEKKG